MEVSNQNIVTAPVVSDTTGDVGGGSSSPAPVDASQGQCEGEAPQQNAKWRSHKNEDKQNLIEKLEKLRQEERVLKAEMEDSERQEEELSEKKYASPCSSGERQKWEKLEEDNRERRCEVRARQFEVETEILKCQVSQAMINSEGAAARLLSLVDFVAADLWCPPEEAGGYLERSHVFSLALSEAVREFRTEQTHQLSNTEADLEDEGFRMPRKEASPNIGGEKPVKKKRKALSSPLAEMSFGSGDNKELEDDDLAIATGLELAVTRAVRLEEEAQAANEKGEIRDHILETISELKGTVEAVQNVWIARTPATAASRGKVPDPSDSNAWAVQVKAIREVITSRNGRGVDKTIQKATTELEGLIAKMVPRKDEVITKTPPVGNGEKQENNTRNNKEREDAGEGPVSNKKRNRKKKKRDKTPKQQAQRKLVPRQQGIVISLATEGASYADVAKKLTAGIDLNALGVTVTAMTRTKAGSIVLSVGKGGEAAKAASKLRVEAEKVLGAEATVRESARPVDMEIVGIGCLDTAIEVLAGICREGIKEEEVNVRRLIPSYGGAQKAVVTVPEAVAEAMIKRGTVKVGFVSCRVRLKQKKIERCFHCHGYGHRKKGCKGTNRENQCMTCGGVGLG